MDSDLNMKFETAKDIPEIPQKIKELIDGKPFIIDEIGLSGNQVLIFNEMVLKIEYCSERIKKQIQVMKWLEGKLPVPKVIVYEEENEKSYFLMSKIDGEMSCDKFYMEHSDDLLKALAEGLNMLWNVDIQECPRVRDLDTMLAEARMRIESGRVDLEEFEQISWGKEHFESPQHLLRWLECNKPDFKPVFSHGDYCLPNVFLKNGNVAGFIDLDRAGVCDKWNDIAICYRSLKYNFDGTYGGKVYENFNPDKLFEVLGIEPDWEKINYFLLLDEL